MATRDERILKNILVAQQALKKDAKRYKDKLVLPQKISFFKKPNYKEVLETLQDFLNDNSFRWVDLEFSFSHKINPFTDVIDSHDIEIKIFLFGRSKFIRKNIKEIARRIIKGKEWRVEKAGISFLQEFSLKNFI